MKDFIIYYQSPQDRGEELGRDVYSLDELENFPGTARFDELDVVRSGKLELVRELESHRVFKFSCEHRTRVTTEIKPTYTPSRFDLWQRKQGPVAVTFDARKKVSKVAVALLSLAVYDDPFAISTVTLLASDFLRLKKCILEERSGNLRQINLSDVETRHGKIGRFVMTATELEQFPYIDDDLIGSASRVSGLGFSLPSIGGGGRTLSFRIKHWGGGQIYLPANPLDHEISGLIDLFEEVLFGGH